MRTVVCRVLWSSRQHLASSGAVLSLPDVPRGSDPPFCGCLVPVSNAALIPGQSALGSF